MTAYLLHHIIMSHKRFNSYWVYRGRMERTLHIVSQIALMHELAYGIIRRISVVAGDIISPSCFWNFPPVKFELHVCYASTSDRVSVFYNTFLFWTARYQTRYFLHHHDVARTQNFAVATRWLCHFLQRTNIWHVVCSHEGMEYLVHFALSQTSG